jgi:hypothetical protein
MHMHKTLPVACHRPTTIFQLQSQQRDDATRGAFAGHTDYKMRHWQVVDLWCTHTTHCTIAHTGGNMLLLLLPAIAIKADTEKENSHLSSD